jgi:hypothetical protein
MKFLHPTRYEKSKHPGLRPCSTLPGNSPKKDPFPSNNYLSIFSLPTLGNTPQKSTKSTFRLTLKIVLRKTPFGPFMPGIKKQPGFIRLFFA